MSDAKFAARIEKARAYVAAAEATLETMGRDLEALQRRRSLRSERRDAVALMLAGVREDWESMAEIVSLYGGDWGALAKPLLAVAITTAEELCERDRLEEVLEEIAIEYAGLR